MRRIILFFIIVFFLVFFYIHQKVSLNIEFYKLTSNYKLYNELVDKRDVLRYNLTQKLNLERVNQWVKNNRLVLPNEEKVLVFNLEKKTPLKTEAKRHRVVARKSHIFILSIGREALAEE